jgi:hypothetical protein
MTSNILVELIIYLHISLVMFFVSAFSWNYIKSVCIEEIWYLQSVATTFTENLSIDLLTYIATYDIYCEIKNSLNMRVINVKFVGSIACVAAASAWK